MTKGHKKRCTSYFFLKMFPEAVIHVNFFSEHETKNLTMKKVKEDIEKFIKITIQNNM